MRFVGLKLQQFWGRAWNRGQGLLPNKWDFLSGQGRISKHLTQKGKERAAGRAVILYSSEQVRGLFQQTPAKVESFPLGAGAGEVILAFPGLGQAFIPGFKSSRGERTASPDVQEFPLHREKDDTASACSDGHI